MTESIENAIKDLRQGKFVLVYDADGREEETDFFIAGEFTTPDKIRIMRKDGGGLIFLMVHHSIMEKLELPFLADLFQESGERYKVLRALTPDDIPYDNKSSFSLTINHRKTFTGITDIDRAMTIKEFANLARVVRTMENGHAIKLFGKNFRSPGHVPICCSSKKPLIDRFGHTELSVALMQMAGLVPVAAGCEMIGDDGRSLSKSKAVEYAVNNNLTFLEGKEIAEAWREWSK